ncbi:hypothetical protein P152DRAFT_235096 [Eremomyces bilateralis CBS 781.70]|uniref:Alpha/beta hydrolase fold-3 domain-containing protein n=1 Tax=Eremomyces bilateralis CBS 781.70 TaxID=1392243 RepID=A0A6G1GA84_9PEZI|nr:uncharacterized protein P152DRAFT_235096 [Eremomyces bilateralis CBS 781.70]KAF1814846.1 hypothetical protein P152DRAFT_235096 [Eremomyces bilateralis CBS 781.70]
MDASPGAMLRMLVPKVPLILKTTVAHSVGLSETASKWDLKTELTIKVIRSFLNTKHPTPISKAQKGSLRDPGVKGRMWVSRVELPAPAEDDIREVLFKAIDDLNVGGEAYYQRPDARSVTAEWTGYRANVGKEEPEPEISEPEKYANLMKENGSTPTILYFHGGAYYLMDPATHRPSTSQLAHLSGGRVLSVRYRLAPKHPFPAALLDALLAYLSLLYPPPDALHAPVPASSIIFAGDSAGGNLSFALLGLLLHLNRSGAATLNFHGQQVSLPLPAGVATNSPWLDVTRSMPSIATNLKYDYLPPRVPVANMAPIPPCDLWPATPPRADLFCHAAMLSHPLVSPLAAPSEFWTGAPPLFFTLGEEMLEDEGRVVARRAAKAGVTVVWVEFEAMPHCFGMLFAGTPGSRRCFEEWGRFCKAVGNGEAVVTKGTFLRAKTLAAEEVEVATMRAVEDAEVARLMEEVRQEQVRHEATQMKEVAKL